MLRRTPLQHATAFCMFLRDVSKRSNQRKQSYSANRNKELAKRWWKLSERERTEYVIAARNSNAIVKKNAHQRKSAAHQSTHYALIMRLLYDAPFGDKFFDQAAAGRIAKRTLELLTDEEKQALLVKYNTTNVTRTSAWKKSEYAPVVQLEHQPLAFAQACRFNSFTHMSASALGRDPSTIFLSVSILGSNMRPTESTLAVLKDRWNQSVKGTPLERLYAPIRNNEVPVFERFCAGLTAQYDMDEIPIAEMFCAYRNIAWTGPQVKHHVMSKRIRDVYQKHLKNDGRHHIFERVLHSRERAALDIATPRLVSGGSVPPKEYTSVPAEDIVPLAHTIAATRVNRSVFDATLEQIQLHAVSADIPSLGR